MILGKDGFAETPPKVVSWMISSAISSFEEKNGRMPKDLTDISGGDGRFLIEGIRQIKPTEKVLKNFRCYEIDEKRGNLARGLVASYLTKEYGFSKSKSMKMSTEIVQITDSLSQEWDTDLCVGNPPYLRIHDISENERKRFKEMEPLLSGRFDMMSLFLAKAFRKSVEGSTICLIVSRSWQGSNACGRMRKFLRNSKLSTEVFDFKDQKIFEEAVLASIVLVSLSQESHMSISDIVLGQDLSTSNLRFDENGGKEPIGLKSRTSNADSKWIPISDFGKISCGIKTTADQVFVKRSFEKKKKAQLKKNGVNTGHLALKFPKSKTYPFIMKPQDIEKWNFSDKTRILYPYNADKSQQKLTKGIEKYFNAAREILEARTYVIEAGRPWSDIWVKSSRTDFERDWKIVWAEIRDENVFAWDNEQHFVGGSCYYLAANEDISSDMGKYLLGLLNSSWMMQQVDRYGASRLLSGRLRWKVSLLSAIEVPFDTEWFNGEKSTEVYDIIDEVDKLISNDSGDQGLLDSLVLKFISHFE